jgi:hypothetical protein
MGRMGQSPGHTGRALIPDRQQRPPPI